MADTRPERRFTRIDRLPPYVFNITAELKMAARRRGEDIIDFSMGNPDGNMCEGLSLMWQSFVV